MELQNFFAQDVNGNIVPGAVCSLFLPGTTTLATGLQDINNVPMGNPFNADANALVQFRAPNGVYDLHIAAGALSNTLQITCADNLQALAELASFLGTHPTAPTVRTDSTPLQLGDRYFNSGDDLEYLYKSTGWEPNNLDGAIIAAPGGSSVVGFQQAGPGSVVLTAAVKMGERMSITDKGAMPGSDCAAAIVSALASTSWDIYVPRGAFIATVTAANAASIFSALNKIKIDGTLTLTVDPVVIAGLSTEVTCNSPDAQKIALIGATPISTTATSQISVSGSAKAYSVTIGVASSAGAVVGNYAKIFTNITGTGDYYSHAGAWEITGVDVGGANRITLLNTHHGAAFPTNTLTGGTVRIIKSVLQFSGCDAFRFEGGQPFGLIDNLIIKGDWNLAAATGTTGSHGIITASPRIAGGGSSNAVFNTAGNGAIGENVGVVSFGEQGIAISGRGVLVANSVASCSNRKRGWYAEGGHIRDKASVGSGNGEDGFIADTTGFIQAALSWACGNGLNGFWSTNNSFIAAATSVASGNLGSGFEARGLTRIGGDLSKSINNGLFGYSATDGGMIDGDGSLADGNGAGGYEGVKGIIDAKNSSSINNIGYGYRGQVGSMVRSSGSGTVSGNTLGSYRNVESIVIDIAGASTPQDVPTPTVGQRVYNPTKTHNWLTTITSIGDMVLSFDGSAKITLKNDGAWQPVVDGGPQIGTTALKFSQVNAIAGRFTGPVQHGQYTMATLPNVATYSGYLIDVTDAAGGPKTCRSDGSAWKILNTTTTVT